MLYFIIFVWLDWIASPSARNDSKIVIASRRCLPTWQSTCKIKYKAMKRDRGMVLVTMMLFLSIISLLALTILNTSLFEVKMGNYFQDKARAFYLAENSLEQYEKVILSGGHVATAEVIDAGICGVTFYRIVASAEYHKAKLATYPNVIQNQILNKADNLF